MHIKRAYYYIITNFSQYKHDFTFFINYGFCSRRESENPVLQNITHLVNIESVGLEKNDFYSLTDVDNMLYSNFDMDLNTKINADLFAKVDDDNAIVEHNHSSTQSEGEKEFENVVGNDARDEYYYPSDSGEEELLQNVRGNEIDKENNRPSDSDGEQGIQRIQHEENDVFNHSKEVAGKRKRSRRGQAKRDTWQQENNKTKRLKGEEHFGRRKNDKGKAVFDVQKLKKDIKPRCSCKDNPKTAFKCYTVSEEARKIVFSKFWSLNWGERKVFVQGLVERRTVAHRNVNSNKHRRNSSLFYHLRIGENQDKVRVCKKMFLNTMSVGEVVNFELGFSSYTK